MPHRQRLLDLLAAHAPADAAEAADRARMIAFVQANPDCFGKANPTGHITGSAFVVDPAGRVLMTHHAKLNRWLQVGGHSEPHEHDPAQTALREAREESGLPDLTFLGPPVPLDLDIHIIPARKADAAHDHLDVRYALRTAQPEAIARSDESHALRWFTLAELAALPGSDAANHRALAKLPALLAADG
ncbi:MAG: NUDIX hydrolase [Myxococcales bacterium]|nr:NUDIX hydrolase [Myxococcales bacterium]MCB9523662.1 NUDIX hydrolase [Myxococcales bacterium]